MNVPSNIDQSLSTVDSIGLEPATLTAELPDTNSAARGDNSEALVNTADRLSAMSDLPITSKAIMRGHDKIVTALSFDPAGSRLASGSFDYSIKLWDFNGMDSSFVPFRTVNPWEGYHVSFAMIYYIMSHKSLCC